MHLHGLKMSIVDIALPNKQQDCTLSKCKLNSVYDSHEEVRALAASKSDTSVLKDTFILPAGGAVVTQIHTQEPSLWYSHCHMEMHHFDGMAFILNVGNYNGSGHDLPLDYPSCETPFLQAHMNYPSCDCYENQNSILSSYLTADYKCSRDHLCHHVSSRAANLEKYYFAGGDAIHSAYKMPGYVISLISLASVCVILVLSIKIKICTDDKDKSEAEEDDPDVRRRETRRWSLTGNELLLLRQEQGDQTRDSTCSRQGAVTLRPSYAQSASEEKSEAEEEDDPDVINFVSKSQPDHFVEEEDPDVINSVPKSQPDHFCKELNEIVRAQFKLYIPLCKYLPHIAFAVNAFSLDSTRNVSLQKCLQASMPFG